MVDAIRYVNDYGVKWRSVPVDFGIPWRTVHGFFQRWRAGGDLARIHAELHEQVRVHDGPECAMSQVTGSDTGTSRTRTSEKHGG
nr:transposase [Streptomyces purpurogeneiscleroticus]